MTVLPTTAPAGTAISVTVLNGPGSATDWLALMAVGAPNVSTSVLAWRYLGGASGTVQMTVPRTVAPGRVRSAVPGERRLYAAGEHAGHGGAAAAALGHGAEHSVNPGDLITGVIANGPGNAKDWVALARPGHPRRARWRGNTLAAVERDGVLSWRRAAGAYEVRLLANDGYVRLATSGPIRSAARAGGDAGDDGGESGQPDYGEVGERPGQCAATG